MDRQKIFSKKCKLVSRNTNNDLVTSLSRNNELMTSLSRYYEITRKFSRRNEITRKFSRRNEITRKSFPPCPQRGSVGWFSFFLIFLIFSFFHATDSRMSPSFLIWRGSVVCNISLPRSFSKWNKCSGP